MPISNNPQWSSAMNAMPAHSHSVFDPGHSMNSPLGAMGSYGPAVLHDPGHTHGIGVPNQTKYKLTLGSAVFRDERYVPAIDKLVSRLGDKTTVQDFPFTTYREDGHFETLLPFYAVGGDEAIHIFKDYNPMYASKPKKIAMKLLLGCSKAPLDKQQGLVKSGLAYPVPETVGIRKYRQRTSAAGLMLLDFWGNLHPKFGKFVDAFVTRKDREEIHLECFDFTMGNMPLSYRQLEKANKENVVKLQAKKYRKMMRQEAKHKAERLRYEQQQALQAHYAQMAKSGMLNASPNLANSYAQLLNAQSYSSNGTSLLLGGIPTPTGLKGSGNV